MHQRKPGTAAFAAVALTLVFAANLSAQALRGSQASVDRMYSFAVRNEFTFMGTAAAIRTAATAGKLASLPATARDYELYQVQHPYLKPEAKLFIERLSSQYRAYCGERLVVTSAIRPMNMKLRNASDLSVHATGMAVDIRSTKIPTKCRNWLRTTLLSLEKAGVVEATEERITPHFHVAVFPAPYTSYLASLGHAVPVVAQAAPAAAQPASQPSEAGESVLVQYQVRSGDSLWRIAVKHDTSVSALQDANKLRSSTIYPGQVILVPVQSPQKPQ